MAFLTSECCCKPDSGRELQAQTSLFTLLGPESLCLGALVWFLKTVFSIASGHMRASKCVLRCIPPHTGIFFFSPRDQLLLSGLVFDVNSPIAGHQQPQEHTGLQMRHAGLDTLHHFVAGGKRTESLSGRSY